MVAADMTAAEIGSNGSHRFDANMAETFAATAGALQVLGYEIAFTNEEKGKIKTSRKFVRAHAQGGAYSAQAVEVSRQYYIDLKADGGGTVVTATPKIFIGERDVSDDRVWVLEGESGERTLWKQLFSEIQSNL